jgi:ribonuclease J
VTEAAVLSGAHDIIASTKGLVVADFGPRNIERLLSFREAAWANGRRLAVTVKDAYLLLALRAAGEKGVPDVFSDERMVVYVEQKATRPAWEKRLIDDIRAGAEGRAVTARDVSADPGEYVVCLSFYDLSELVDLRPAGGTYIYSSSEAFNEEMHTDMDRLRNWVSHFGMEFAGDPGDRAGWGRAPGLHASGHIHGPGLIELVTTIKPRILIPVHTDQTTFFVHNFRDIERGTKLRLPRTGQTIEV